MSRTSRRQAKRRTKTAGPISGRGPCHGLSSGRCASRRARRSWSPNTTIRAISIASPASAPRRCAAIRGRRMAVRTPARRSCRLRQYFRHLSPQRGAVSRLRLHRLRRSRRGGGETAGRAIRDPRARRERPARERRRRYRAQSHHPRGPRRGFARRRSMRASTSIPRSRWRPRSRTGVALVAAAEAKRLRVGAAPDTVLGAGVQGARALIDAGSIGKPLTGSQP